LELDDVKSNRLFWKYYLVRKGYIFEEDEDGVVGLEKICFIVKNQRGNTSMKLSNMGKDNRISNYLVLRYGYKNNLLDPSGGKQCGGFGGIRKLVPRWH
jgi:hypothetical protein